MKKIITIGETVLDIIFKNNQPVRAVPGGAMLNTAVSLGRIGLPVYFTSEVGNDHSGRLIKDFLAENRVSPRFVNTYRDGKTFIAMAFLDKDNKAEYDFYRLFPAKRLAGPLPPVKKNDLFLFGSFFSLDRGVRDRLVRYVAEVKEAGGIIIYDPNFRKSHLHELPELLPLIVENIGFADIVKGSDDDFEMIIRTSKIREVFEFIKSRGCSRLVLTRGPGDVELMTDTLVRSYPVKKVPVKSTIGAGDNFNAGILYSLFKLGATKPGLAALGAGEWDFIVDNAVALARNVCQSYENYIDEEFAARISGDADLPPKNERRSFLND